MNGKYAQHYPTLLRLGIPIMIGQLGTIVMGFCDTLMIGHHSTQELAAAGFVNNIMGLVLIAGMGFSYGLTPIVGALLGEGRTGEIAAQLKSSLFCNLLMAALLMLSMLALWLGMYRIGMPRELVPLMRPYLLVLTLSILPQMLFNAYKQFSDGLQDTRTPMYHLVGGNALNIVLNWLLIFGIGPLPELGLLGAGIATLLSRVLMWATFHLIFHHTHRCGTHRRDYPAAPLRRSDMHQLTRLGLPVMLQLGMESASFSLSALYVGWIGLTALAAHQIMITISQLCFMLYYGMAAAVAVQVSYYRGAGQMEQTRRVALAGLHLTWVLGIGTALPVFVLRHHISFWFNADPGVACLVSSCILMLCLYQFGDALQCIYANALRGMADVRPMIWIAFVAYFVVSLPLGYLFGFTLQGGLPGIWMAFPFGLTTAGVLYCLRFYRR